MEVQLPSARGALGLGHVLPEDLEGGRPPDQHGTEVADQRPHGGAFGAKLRRQGGEGHGVERHEDQSHADTLNHS